MAIELPHYGYEVFWCAEDGEYVARCREFPRLSGLASTPAKAIEELNVALTATLEQMLEAGERWPEPLPVQKLA